MVAFLSLLLSLLVWLPAGDLQSGDDQGVGASGGVLAPQSHSAASAEFVCRGRLSNVFKLLTVVMLAMFALSEHKEMERADRQDLMATLRSSQADMAWLGLGVLLDAFGKAYLAFLFCADASMDLIAYIHAGDEGDGASPEAGGVDPAALRRKEMADIGTLRGGATAVVALPPSTAERSGRAPAAAGSARSRSRTPPRGQPQPEPAGDGGRSWTDPRDPKAREPPPLTGLRRSLEGRAGGGSTPRAREGP